MSGILTVLPVELLVLLHSHFLHVAFTIDKGQSFVEIVEDIQTPFFINMEKYRLVEEQKGSGDDFLETISASEVRITQQGKPRNYITYTMNLFVRFQIGNCCEFLLLFTNRRLTYLLSFLFHR